MPTSLTSTTPETAIHLHLHPLPQLHRKGPLTYTYTTLERTIDIHLHPLPQPHRRGPLTYTCIPYLNYPGNDHSATPTPTSLTSTTPEMTIQLMYTYEYILTSTTPEMSIHLHHSTTVHLRVHPYLNYTGKDHWHTPTSLTSTIPVRTIDIYTYILTSTTPEMTIHLLYTYILTPTTPEMTIHLHLLYIPYLNYTGKDHSPTSYIPYLNNTWRRIGSCTYTLILTVLYMYPLPQQHRKIRDSWWWIRRCSCWNVPKQCSRDRILIAYTVQCLGGRGLVLSS